MKQFKNKFIALLGALFLVCTLPTPSVEAEIEMTPFGQAFDFSFNEANSRVVKTAASLGFAFRGVMPNGDLVFIHHQPKPEILAEALKLTDYTTNDIVSGDIVLLVRIIAFGEQSYVNVNSLVLGYVHDIVKDVRLKVFAPSFSMMINFMKVMGGETSDSEMDFSKMTTMELEISPEEVDERFQLLQAFRRERVSYYDSQNRVMVLQQRVADFESLKPYFKSRALDDRFDYQVPMMTCIIYWKESTKNPGHTEVSFLPAVLAEKQTTRQQMVKERGYDTALRPNTLLPIYFKNQIMSYLQDWPYQQAAVAS